MIDPEHCSACDVTKLCTVNAIEQYVAGLLRFQYLI